MDRCAEVLGAAREAADCDLPLYSAIASRAFRETPAVFFAAPYDDFFWHCAANIPNWLPNVVTACALTEGHGAHSLLKIWAGVNYHPQAEAGLLRHAKDESGHARLFAHLARLIFEDNFAPGSLDKLENSLRPIERIHQKKSHCSVPTRLLLDYLIQLNIVEIRTRRHLQLLAPMYYALAPHAKKLKVEKILNGLAHDETSHVAYTAKLINDWAQDDDLDRMTGVYVCRLNDYNQHTLDHCDPSKNDYGQGRFEVLFNDYRVDVKPTNSATLPVPS